MNIDQYLAKEGYTHLQKSCALCNNPRFFSDLCVQHTRSTLRQLDEHIEETRFTLFIHEAIRESGLLGDLDEIDQAIESLFDDAIRSDEIAKILNVSVEYVKEVINHEMP